VKCVHDIRSTFEVEALGTFNTWISRFHGSKTTKFPPKCTTSLAGSSLNHTFPSFSPPIFFFFFFFFCFYGEHLNRLIISGDTPRSRQKRRANSPRAEQSYHSHSTPPSQIHPTQNPSFPCALPAMSLPHRFSIMIGSQRLVPSRINHVPGGLSSSSSRVPR
jgi:hypothetical protein